MSRWLAGALIAATGIASAQEQTAPTRLCELVFSNGVTLADVPLAETRAQMAKGLSGVDQVGRGMLFAWPDEQPRVVWMRGTSVALSVGFIAADGTLFAVEHMTPNTETPHLSMKPAKDALELPQGDFARQGINQGGRLLRRHCQPIQSEKGHD